MRGSPGESLLERLVSALRAESIQPTGQDLAQATESIPAVTGNISVSDRMAGEKRICSAYGLEYSAEETLMSSPGFWESPYNYSQAAARCCLACSLGVGPNDIAEMYAEWNEEGIVGRSSRSGSRTR